MTTRHAHQKPVFVNFKLSWDRHESLTERELLVKALIALKAGDCDTVWYSEGPRVPAGVSTAESPILSIEARSIFFDSLYAPENSLIVLKTWIKETDYDLKCVFRKDDLFVAPGNPRLNHSVYFGPYSQALRRSKMRDYFNQNPRDSRPLDRHQRVSITTGGSSMDTS